VRVPSVEWLIVSDTLTEVFNPITLQLDYWARHPTQAATIERRLRNRLHRATRRTLEGMDMSTTYEDSLTLESPMPGVIHRALRFRIEPVRQRAATERPPPPPTGS
jgi:hypothetical protein